MCFMFSSVVFCFDFGFFSPYFVPLLGVCHNPSLGLATKARGCKVAGQERKPESERKCERLNPHTPKGAPTLGIGVPMDSRMFRE